MVLRVFLLCFCVVTGLLPLAGRGGPDAAEALAWRLLGERADSIVFREMAPAPGGRDVFRLATRPDGRLQVEGNSAGSMAVGLNHYLKYYCCTSVSWEAADQVELPAALPVLERPVRVEARVAQRFFLNYCTFGYTMPWWRWADWERFIDWMALNGVNLPLAITGQEAVWLKVWTDLGIPADTVRAYFTGPAHLPWHRMLNMDHFQGPLPMSYIEGQARLQQRIVARERELGMRPVLPAFSGHVPQAIRRIYPDAHITRMSSWGGFRDAYRSWFLDPMDPLFAEVQRRFLKEQRRLYGTDHVYGIDPFNEIESPSWAPDYLARVARRIYGTVAEEDPKATWLQMTWLFYFDSVHWTPERIRAYLRAVPQDRMLLLDYYAENVELWRRTESYFGQPFLWCYLGNFGGNTMLAGNFHETSRRLDAALGAQGKNSLSGIGATLEAFGVNRFMYEFVLEKAWDTGLTDREWVDALADRRAGWRSPLLRHAWQTLVDSVYVAPAQLGQGTLTNARPGLTGTGNWTTNPTVPYDNRLLCRVWGQMAEAGVGQTHRDAYLYDLVNVGRQVLSNHFRSSRDSLTVACGRGDAAGVMRWASEMSALLDDLEQLLSCHRSFLFGRWQQAAEDMGATPEERAWFRRNARTLVTTWGERGQSLNDYANRSLAGLTADFYAARWRRFLREVMDGMAAGRPFDEKAFREGILDFEAEWALSGTAAGPLEPRADGYEVARRLWQKYRPAIMGGR